MRSIGLCLACILIVPPAAARVRTWEGTVEIPTYLLGPEDPNPAFPLTAPRRVYPYTLLDDLTDERRTKSYRALFLENEFLRATILPDLGGRILSLYDKMARREVFYRNHVVKPSLIAVRGAWISGGLEFNFPDAHTATAVSPVSSKTISSRDGSASVAVGDLDWASGMYWEVKITLRPGEARLELWTTLFNPTPLAQRYWYWDIAAIYAGEDLQLIYPMREAYTHNRGEVFSYPVHEGNDWSRYEDHVDWMSLFGRGVQRNFFGAYYHASDYGIVHWSDYTLLPGKKIWTWGKSEDGKLWGEDALTDSDGPYNEIQAGRYETQLNYEFMPPRRVESFAEYWYPVRGMSGGFLEATDSMALNVLWPSTGGAGGERLELAIFVTVTIPNAQIRVELGGKRLGETRPVRLQAGTAQRFSFALGDVAPARESLGVRVEASGRLLLRWSAADPVDGNPHHVPTVGQKASVKKALSEMTADELFHLAQVKEKEYGVELSKPGEEQAVVRMYEEVVERDPGYAPALLKLASRRYRGADFEGAWELVHRALRRSPYDPEATYAAGEILRGLKRLNEATLYFWTSAHYGGPPARAFAQLGQIAIHQKDFERAATWLRRALVYNPDDAMAWADLAVASRLAGRLEEGERAVEEGMKRMSLLPFLQAERRMILQTRRRRSVEGAKGAVPPRMLASPNLQDYLEVAGWYHRLNDLDAADSVLLAALKEVTQDHGMPLVYYYLAAHARANDRAEQAAHYASLAADAPIAYVFPSRLEDAEILHEAVESHPADARARYYMGNFLFAHDRYEEAFALWIQAGQQGLRYSVLERNLGVHYWLVSRDLGAAAQRYERAIELEPEDFKLYADLDDILLQMGDLARRESLFRRAPPGVLRRDIVAVRAARLLLQQGQYEKALNVLEHHRFKPGDGRDMNREVYVALNIARGRALLSAGQFEAAIDSFKRAAEYPTQLGIGKPFQPADSEAYYWLGEALAADGRVEAADNARLQAVEQGKHRSGPPALFRALALARLHREGEADVELRKLVEAAEAVDASGLELYVAGRLEQLRGNDSRARQYFLRAVRQDPFLWQASMEVASHRATASLTRTTGDEE